MKPMNLVIALLFLISCTNSESRVYKTLHFKIFYTKLDDKNIKDIADSLENNYPKISTSLQPEGLPIINVHFYTNIIDLQKAVKTSVPNLPSWEGIGLCRCYANRFSLAIFLFLQNTFL
jgi:hypothetical protein